MLVVGTSSFVKKNYCNLLTFKSNIQKNKTSIIKIQYTNTSTFNGTIYAYSSSHTPRTSVRRSLTYIAGAAVGGLLWRRTVSRICYHRHSK